jgi:hypothetical protein
LREEISEWMKKDHIYLANKSGQVEKDILNRAEEIKTKDVWGSDIEIEAFCRLSDIDVVVYAEEYDIIKKDRLLKYVVRRATERVDYITILLCKTSPDLNVNNHFRSVMKDVSKFQSVIDKFVSEVLLDESKDDIT